MWILISSVLDPLQTKCQLARAQGLEARARSRGSPAAAVFVPACGPEGHFMPIQCHNQTGYCWCSTPDGKPVSGTTALHVIPNCTGQLCFIQTREDERFIPECTADGRYSPVQCHTATGYCWCVRVDTGRPRPGTSARLDPSVSSCGAD
uniref:Thyroglobulin type-1 domain-containing protein n=1 Tax=Pundamilia nyererei TaxID=303518 RepID=A0A3B4FBN9_9CICH